ncbi:MAG: Holliday junction branch migration protein RuvA [Actinobacteria bacterium]|jgi:Holliday junction DNA helicase RuvA|nr:Holliday junction branch migration protein RuvA [Actinomycetota bacterium]MCL6095935.1 Holliday junction branch migration protein RuvA [Actinomycetota bacterium]
MIGSLRGVLLDREGPLSLLLDVGGVGYRLTVPATLAANLQGVGDELLLYVHTRVRDDSITLYGFATLQERRYFEVLLGVHGVGPSMALAILSSYSADELADIVDRGDAHALTSIPGIGTRTAERLLVELKTVVPTLASTGTDVSTKASGRLTTAQEEVIQALMSLGYRSDQAQRALSSLDSSLSIEELLRDALRELARWR